MTQAAGTLAPTLPIRVLLSCLHRFGPYHVSRLQAAARHMAATGIEFSGMDRTYAWNASETLPFSSHRGLA